MAPGDVSIVRDSWLQLRPRSQMLLDVLCRRFQVEKASTRAALRAAWLVRAVDELIDLLSEPSRLAEHARPLAPSWPDGTAAPTAHVDGRAWTAAAAVCLPTWSPQVEDAWRQAWLLLADVLACEILCPFGTPPSS